MILKGKVKKGKGEGRTTGFPSANLEIGEAKIDAGIYFSKVNFDQRKYLGASYVGSNRPNILETHILDFNQDIYDKEIEVEIIEKMRDEVLTDDFEEINKLIKKDIENVKSK